MPGWASTAKLALYRSMASRLAEKSASFRAASSLAVPLTMPVASISQPRPSLGSTMSSGAPLRLSCTAGYSKEMPIGNSPAAACLHGLEPEWVYWPMFWCSLSM
ncbi:hypothetical protein D9M70_561720 [compost metagenome]